MVEESKSELNANIRQTTTWKVTRNIHQNIIFLYFQHQRYFSSTFSYLCVSLEEYIFTFLFKALNSLRITLSLVALKLTSVTQTQKRHTDITV